MANQQINATPFHVFMDHLLAHMQAAHAMQGQQPMQPGAGVMAPQPQQPNYAQVPQPGAGVMAPQPGAQNTSAVKKGNPLRDALIQGSKPLQAHLLQLLTSHG